MGLYGNITDTATTTNNCNYDYDLSIAGVAYADTCTAIKVDKNYNEISKLATRYKKFESDLYIGNYPDKPKNNEEPKMKKFNIVDYKVYNNKAVAVTFEDGTEEKAVCNEDDNFDLERGVEVCVLKHVLGVDKYKELVREANRQIKAVDKAIEDKKAEEEMIARKKAKAARHKAKRLERKRNARIAEMKEAYLGAMLAYDDIMFAEHEKELASEGIIV